jgi:hypothetical protein
MRFTTVGMAFAAESPEASAAWFVEHFGFRVGIDIGWYVNTQHVEVLRLVTPDPRWLADHGIIE